MTAKNIHQRIAAVMGDVSYIQKERKAGMNYTIVSHDTVTGKVRPAMLAHGIVYYPVRCEHHQNGNRAECAMTVRFANIDEPSDFIDVPTFGYGIDPQDKGPGKAMSYAMKYAVLKTLGLETGDDPEADSIDHTDRDPAIPPFDPSAAATRIIGAINKQETVSDLRALLDSEKDARGAVKDAAPEIYKQITAAAVAKHQALEPRQGEAA